MVTTRQDYYNAIQALDADRQANRVEERRLASRSKYLNSIPLAADGNDLKSNLSKILPKRMLPTNVGSYKQILLPFHYNVEFNLGLNPTFTPTFRANEKFQVTQEAGFLLTKISRTWRNRSAGFNAPVSVTIRDNQSSRQFNNTPIPIQQIGYAGCPLTLETPFLFMPNAYIGIELTSWIDNTWQIQGDGYQELTFMGYRISVQDAQYVTDSIFL
jgi:hypothetical protein